MWTAVSLLCAAMLASTTASTAGPGQSTAVVNQPWSYTNLPPGFSWIARKNTDTGAIVYYGLAGLSALPPLTPGETVYVGPDSIFYHFKHAPPIVPCDLTNKWSPNSSGSTAISEPKLPIPVPSPSAPPSAVPSPSALPQYRYIIRPPQLSPVEVSQVHIFEIDVNDQVLSSRGPLSVRVLTSVNVKTVYVSAASRTIAIPQLGAGDFEFSGTIPALPFFVRGKSFSAQFEATTLDGCRTAVSVPFSITR